MNAQFQVAQATSTAVSTSTAKPRIFKLTKPLTDQAVVINLGYDQKVQIDFSSIANEKITLVHVGEKLIILFDNQSTVTVEPFFDSRADGLQNVTIEVAPGRLVSVNEFASLFPITTDQAVLPAAGTEAGNGNAQASGANFTSVGVTPLLGGDPLALLPQEQLGNFVLTPEPVAVAPTEPPAPTPPAGPTIVAGIGLPLSVDESFIPVIGSQQAPAGSNVDSAAFASAFTVNAPAGVQSVTYALTVNNATSNLIDSISGQVVQLVQNGAGGVLGVVNILGVPTTVFTLTVDGAGNVTMTELRAVKEGTPGDFNEGISLAAGLVSLTATVTDVNNNSASASLDLGPQITIQDDGPTIAVTGAVPTLAVDETDFATDASVSFAGLFTPVFGADGFKDTDDNDLQDADAITYALGVVAGPSGLVDTLTNSAVNLVLNGTTVEGRSADGNNLVFTITVDATGLVTLDQQRSVVHNDPLDPDEPGVSAAVLSASNLITLTATITDGDGDTNTAVANIGGSFQFEDDGPSTAAPDYAVLSNGTGNPVPVVFGLDFDNTLTNNYGADGGTVRFPSSLNGPSGLTSNGVAITYTVSNGGLTLTGMAGLISVFVITLDPATATYSVDMNATVDSITNVNFNDGTYDFVGGNSAWAGFVPNGQEFGDVPLDDSSKDLLLTPFGIASTINGNANGAGTGGTGPAGAQNISAGEGIRLDFVEDLDGNSAGSGGYYNAPSFSNQDNTFDNHYLTNGVTVRFGDGSTDTTLRITARNDLDGNIVVGDGTLNSVTSVAINYDGETEIITFANIGTTSMPFTVGNPGGLADRTYTVQFVDADGVGPGTAYYVQVTGVLDTNVTIATFAQSNYNSLELLNVSGDDFEITGFGAAVQSTNPVSFDVPIEVVDGDGDIAASVIGITLTEPGGLIQNHSLDIVGSSYLSTVAEPHIIGSDLADTLTGNGGINVLSGGRGGDIINGAGGNDVLIGGDGIDNLTGGTGADQFLYNARTDGIDQIVDFSGHGGQLDVLVFDSAAFGNLAAGTLALANFASNASGTATAATAQFVYNETTGTLSYDSDGSGAAAIIALAVLQNGFDLNNTDIRIV